MELPRVGEVLAAHYRLDAILGEGGFATVYRATDVRIDRTVAVKVLRPGAGGYDPSHAARFMREARVVGELADDHTMRLFDFGRTDSGLFYMVLEYLDGEDLSDLIARRQRLSEAEVELILRQMLSSLREAHQKQLVHRDIKPANIRVVVDGGGTLRAKLMDFGVARHTHADAVSLTRTGDSVGTLAYMSPEQMRGDAVTPAADIYSLGLTMAEALTGSWRHLRTSGGLPDLPGQRLGPVLSRMLAVEPRSRPQTADEVLRLLDGPGPPSPAAAKAARPHVAPVRAPGPWAVPVGVALLAAVLLAIAVGFASREPRQPPARSVRTLPTLVRTAETSTEGAPESAEGRDAGAADAAAADAGAGDGCAQTPFLGFRAVKHTSELRVGYWTRYLPTSYEPGTRHPVLLVFHNNFSDPRDVIRRTGMTALADREQIVVFALEGGSLDLEAWEHRVEPSAVWSMLQESAGEACLDLDRVYAFGHGTGGLAVEALACAPWVRAIATTSHRSNLGEMPCPDEPKPYIYFYPTRSRHIPLDGEKRCESNTREIETLAHQLETWRKRNGCRGAARRISEHERSYCEEWECEAPFVACRVDGGLEWPRAAKRRIDMLGCDGPRPDYPYHDRIVSFLERFDL